jgi:Uma2 family endonuclease
VRETFFERLIVATASAELSGQSLSPPVARYFTAADLAAMPDQLPSGPVDFELHQGRFVPLSPSGFRHSNLQARISKELVSQGEELGHGEAGSGCGVILSKKPDTVVGPDALFVTKRSMPIRQSPEDYLETIPELIVEIRGKNDSLAEFNCMVADYLQAGVRLVWMVDPQSKTVTEHRRGAAPRNLTVADTLTCDDIIPGFDLSLADFFQD